MSDNYLDQNDINLIVSLAGCSLAKTPGKVDSWVEAVGGEIPEYICRIAKNLVEGGSSTSAAIATAVNTVKRWAAGGTSAKSGPRAKKVHADTQAKAAAALAQWEALKAKAKTKKVAATSNDDGSVLLSSKLSSFDTDGDVVTLCGANFSTEEARRSYNDVLSVERKLEYQKHKASGSLESVSYEDNWIEEVWTNGLVVRRGSKTSWVPFKYDGIKFHFGPPQDVKIAYIPVSALGDSDEKYEEDEKPSYLQFSKEEDEEIAKLSKEEADTEISRILGISSLS